MGTICLAAGLFGYLLREAPYWQRALLIGAAIMLIKPGIVTDIIGATLLATVVIAQLAAGRRDAATGAPPPGGSDDATPVAESTYGTQFKDAS